MSRPGALAAHPQVPSSFAVGSTWIAAAILGVSTACVTEGDVFSAPGSEGGGPPVAELATLYAHDPLRHTLDLESGDYGSVLTEVGVQNRNSHLDFGFYLDDGFTVGVQGSERGALIDLGDDAELAAARGSGSIFGSLAMKGGVFNVPEAAAVLAEGQANQAPVQVGHVYVARIVRDEGDIVAKWIVADHQPGRSVVIDWVRLR